MNQFVERNHVQLLKMSPSQGCGLAWPALVMCDMTQANPCRGGGGTTVVLFVLCSKQKLGLAEILQSYFLEFVTLFG